jgi:hypothetical protein
MSHQSLCHVCQDVTSVRVSHLSGCHVCHYVTSVTVSRLSGCHVCQGVTSVRVSRLSLCHTGHCFTSVRVSHLSGCHICQDVTSVRVSHMSGCHICHCVTSVRVSRLSGCHICQGVTSVRVSPLVLNLHISIPITASVEKHLTSMLIKPVFCGASGGFMPPPLPSNFSKASLGPAQAHCMRPTSVCLMASWGLAALKYFSYHKDVEGVGLGSASRYLTKF